MDCPLPIDWLDYLEKREVDASVDLAAHLNGCRRCQLLVDDLRQQSVGVELASYQGVALREVPKWREEERTEIAVGDIWLTKGELEGAYSGLRRQLVLVVGQREEFNRVWFSFAPLTTETETATSSDLLLAGNDTTLGVPLAAQFRIQTPLAREQLDSYLGETTDSGRELVASAVAGTVESARFGAAIASPNDRRLRRVEETRELMAALANVYGEALNRAEEAAEEAAESVEASEASEAPSGLTLVGAPERAERQGPSEAEQASEEGHVFVFQLKRVKPPAQEGVLAWAAATVRRTNPLINHFAFEGERCALRARLELKGMRGEEMLLLFIEDVSGFSSAPVLISFAKPSGERIESPPFDPALGAEVVVARGAVGVSPADVDQLELRLS
jgi:hypothetical protein